MSVLEFVAAMVSILAWPTAVVVVVVVIRRTKVEEKGVFRK